VFNFVPSLSATSLLLLVSESVIPTHLKFSKSFELFASSRTVHRDSSGSHDQLKLCTSCNHLDIWFSALKRRVVTVDIPQKKETGPLHHSSRHRQMPISSNKVHGDPHDSESCLVALVVQRMLDGRAGRPALLKPVFMTPPDLISDDISSITW
jgi:hypothetical protein